MRHGILSLQTPAPAILMIHAMGESAEALYTDMLDAADMGYVAVAMDCRYHGLRSYSGALFSSLSSSK